MPLKRIKNFFRPKALILLYHRVTDLLPDPHRLCVSPQHFAEHLEVLQKYYKPVKLQDLLTSLRQGNLQHQTVVVTFDDGYADNLLNANPLLQRYGIPATFFITSGYINQKREFWWDELERLLLQPGKLPKKLELKINNALHTWDMGEDADYSTSDCKKFRDWNVEHSEYPGLRQSTYHALGNQLRLFPDHQRRSVMAELLEWGKASATGRQTHRTLSAAELCQLAAGELAEIGAHTVTHSVLASLSPESQKAEILQSKDSLQEIIGKPVHSFAFPHGQRSDYTSDTIAILKKAGFTCACAAFREVVMKKKNPFQLPRFMVANLDGDKFEHELKKWFRG